jgi:FSR family fosmidomycin resistance protein-like MFS transporter
MLDIAIPAPKPTLALARERSRALVSACAAHVLHDGYTDLLYVLLPIWKVEFGLGYAALGIVRATYNGVMAGAQVPVDRLTRSLGARIVLVGGTLLAALGFLLASASHGIVLLCLSLAIAGLGSSTQHPRASAIVTETFGAKSRGPLGIYNFAGDVGKAIFPAVTALLLIALTWHAVTIVLAAIGLLFAIGLFVLLPSGATVAAQAERTETKVARHGHRGGFWVLFVIGALDTSTRMGFLLFLPFILGDRQASHATVGVALALVFAGGAFGKFTCGWLGERIGMLGTVTVTEGATAALILLVPLLPLGGILVVLPILGVALNGTSSVLYGTVPDVAKDGNVSRAFALFYTGVIGAGALAPIAFGTLADHAGRNAALGAAAATALCTVPLALVLRRRLHANAAAF